MRGFHEYQIIIYHEEGRDRVLFRVETEPAVDRVRLKEEIQKTFKNRIGIKADCECVKLGELPCSEKKSRRVFDYRYETQKKKRDGSIKILLI